MGILLEKKIDLSVGRAILAIYDKSKDAIEKGWESLYFSNNCDTFAVLIIGDHVIQLLTHGEVLIAHGDTRYSNKDEEYISALLDQGKLWENCDIEIIDNNWFSIDIGEIEDSRKEDDVISVNHIDDYTFEPCPKTIDELVSVFIEFAIWAYDVYVDLSDEDKELLKTLS